MGALHGDRQSFRFRSRAPRTKRGHFALRLEQLEARRLLSADTGPEWRWFESFDAVPRLSPTQLDSFMQVNSGAMGPHDLITGEWIVQWSRDRAVSMDSLSKLNTLLDHDHVDMTVIGGLGSEGLVLMRGRAITVEDVEETLQQHADVEFFHRNTIIEGQSLPNDPEFLGGLLPGLNVSGVVPSWDVSQGNSTVVVGVLDTGIDATHADLFLNIWLNQGEIPDAMRASLTDLDGDGIITFYDLNNLRVTDAGILIASTGVLASVEEMTMRTPFDIGVNGSFVSDKNGNGRIDAVDLLEDVRWADGRDNDGNTFFDDLFGVNFRSGSSDDPFARNRPLDALGHGTHVAGTIGAVGNNGFGVVGVNWQTSLMSLRILDNDNRSSAAAAIMAVNYASAMQEMLERDSNGQVIRGANVKVLNNSWGQPSGFDRALEASIRRSDQAGILFVAAAGNGNILGEGVNNDQTPFFPASYEIDNVISVAALSTGGERLASFSNFGPRSVDVAAPGVGVRSTLNGGGFGSANGTSMATPHVSGTAALIWSALPFADLDEIRQTILSTAESVTGAAPFGSAVSPVASGRMHAVSAITSDSYSPGAELLFANDILVSGSGAQSLQVRFSHPSGVDTNSLFGSSLTVQSSWGDRRILSAPIDFNSISVDGNEVTAQYLLQPPGGSWDPLDFGRYDVSIAADTVRSQVAGVGNRANVIGSFQVKVQEPGFFYVDTLADTPDANPGDGLALDSSGRTSLRAAIQEANAGSTPITVILQSGEYRFRQFGLGEDLAATGDLDIANSVAIIGDAAASVRLIAEHSDRVFHVLDNAELNLQRVAVSGGLSQGDGGGVLVEGTLDAADVIVTDNIARRGAAIAVMQGASLSLTGQSSIELNRATNTDLPSQRRVGGAVFFDIETTGYIHGATIASNVTDGVAQVIVPGTRHRDFLVHIENSTISNNTENGLFLLGATNLFHTTIVGNERLGINFWNGETAFENPEPRDGELLRIGSSIIVQNGVASSSFQELTGDITLGRNVIQDDPFGDLGSIIFNDPTDIRLNEGSGVVLPLDFYGRATRHHPPAPSGFAIDRGGNLSNVDQYGTPRPADGNNDGTALADAGAIEATDSKIQGIVFDDRNFNGVKDADEPGLAGQLVFIDANQDGQLNDGEVFDLTLDDDLRTPTVNERGRYTLSPTPGMTQTVVVSPSQRWVVSEPAIQRVSETEAGVGGNRSSGARFPILSDILQPIRPAISETGRFVSFYTQADNLAGTNIDRLTQAATESEALVHNKRLAADGSRFELVPVDSGATQGTVHRLTKLDGTTRTLGEPVSLAFDFRYDGFDITPDQRVFAARRFGGGDVDAKGCVADFSSFRFAQHGRQFSGLFRF